MIHSTVRYFYYLIRSLLRVIQRFLSPNLSCKLQNLFLFLCGSKLRFYFIKDEKIYLAKENAEKRYFANQDRGFGLYGYSLLKRGEFLFNSYCLGRINFNLNDIVIDCGANYADLFLKLKHKILPKNYITFEPNLEEYNCIIKNVIGSRNFNLGLSNSEGDMNLFLPSSGGDACFVKPQNFEKSAIVKVTTLDNFMISEKIKKCKLLKLEAEGWGPEVLEGALNFFKICQYIAIDGSRERGMNKEPTFHTMNNVLLKNNYIMIDINGPAYRALYKNIYI